MCRSGVHGKGIHNSLTFDFLTGSFENFVSMCFLSEKAKFCK